MTKSHVGQVIAYLIKSVRESCDPDTATSNSPTHSLLRVQAFGLGTSWPAHSPIRAWTIDQTSHHKNTWSVCKGVV